jgi:hypothetical protein
MNFTLPMNSRDGRPARPKRPLSAFNLFYRYKRQKVLKVLASNPGAGKELIKQLVFSPAGLECYVNSGRNMLLNLNLRERLQRQNILDELQDKLEPRDNKARSHHKDPSAMNGGVTFVELGKLMTSSWVQCDEFAKKVFKELSDEGRERYRLRLLEFKSSSKGADFAKTSKRSYKKKLPSKKSKAQGSPRSPSKDIERDHTGTENEAAEIMIELLTKKTPAGDVGTRSIPSTKESHPTPTLLDLLSSRQPNDEVFTEQKMTARDDVNKSSTASGLHQDPSKEPNYQQNAALTSELTQIQHGRKLDAQHSEERLQARIRELEEEMSRRNAKEIILRTVLDNVIAQKRAATSTATTAPSAMVQRPAAAMTRHAPRLLAQDGMWSLASASLIHPSIQATERASMFSKIVQSPRRDPTEPSSEQNCKGFKKQRLV